MGVQITTASTDNRVETSDDVRLDPPKWRTPDDWRAAQTKLRLLLALSVVLAGWYFEWLLRAGRVGNPVLYGLLVSAELFNLVQAAGFWWTCRHGRDREPAPRWSGPLPAVDVMIPVYNEPLDVVAPTVAAAVGLRGAEVTVYLLDDAGRPELADLARRAGARYVRREGNIGAKAGNLNHALGLTQAPFVVVFDCDHVPDPRFLEATLGWMQDDRVGFVQTPQYYANARTGRLAAAAWSQQALFFGGIAGNVTAVARLGFYPPTLWAYLVGFTECFCAIALALGLFTRLAALFIIGEMAFLAFHVQIKFGYFWTQRGNEFPLLLLLLTLAIFFRGGGRFSLDHLIGKEL